MPTIHSVPIQTPFNQVNESYANVVELIRLIPKRQPTKSKKQTILPRQRQCNERLVDVLDPSHRRSNSKRKEVESLLNEAAAIDRPTYLKLVLNLLESFECGGTRVSRPTKFVKALLAQEGHGDAAKYYCATMYLLYPELKKLAPLLKLESEMKAQDWILQAKRIGMTGPEANTIFKFVGEISPPELQAVSHCIKEWYNLNKDHPSLDKFRAAVDKNDARMQAQHDSKGLDPSKVTKKAKIKFGDQSMWYLFWFILEHGLEHEIQPLVPRLIPYLTRAGLVDPTKCHWSLSFRDLLLAIHEYGQEYDTYKQAAFMNSIYGHANAPMEQAPSLILHPSDDESSVGVDSDESDSETDHIHQPTVAPANEEFDAEVESINNSMPVNETQTFAPLTSPVLNASTIFVAAEGNLLFPDLNSPMESVSESLFDSTSSVSEDYPMVDPYPITASDPWIDQFPDQSVAHQLMHHVLTPKREREGYDQDDEPPAQRPCLFRDLGDEYIDSGLETLNGCARTLSSVSLSYISNASCYGRPGLVV